MKRLLFARGVFAIVGVMTVVVFFNRADATLYSQTNLVSDVPGLAKVLDANLVNPWGIAYGGTGPLWVANNHTGTATLYDGNTGAAQGLVVTIPGGAPTGEVYNAGSGFNSDRFIFAGEDGTIAGWRGALGTTAETLVLGSPDHIYKGLAIATVGVNDYIYAADFHGGKVDVYPGTGGAPSLPGTFTDPALPAGYAPFGIQNIGGQIYVAYAVQDATQHDEVAGPGAGIVDIYTTSGVFVKRLISNGGVLNAPWGMTVAPAGFGDFSGDLLVGNFGDGLINAFDAAGAPLGVLRDGLGNPIVNEGLWGLTFGNGGTGGPADALFITVGVDDENHGLLARIRAIPEPLTTVLLMLAGAAGGLRATARRR